MKKRWVVLSTIMFTPIFAGFIANYHANHSGPFVHFRMKYPEYSTAEVAEQGSKDINRFFALEQTRPTVNQYIGELQMECKKMTAGDLKFESYYESHENIVDGYYCRHYYGFIPGFQVWRVAYLLTNEGSVRQGRSLLVCAICQGI